MLPSPARSSLPLPGLDRIAIIDVETTGLRAGVDRIIEVGAAIWCDGEVVDTFSELMDPGCRIPGFITSLTGISQAMVRGRPSPEAVMPRLRAFLDGHACLAHNAAFDQRFYCAEMARAGQPSERPFLCSMLLARRLVQQAPNHQLGTLVRHLRLTIPAGLRSHRALADVLMTGALWQHLLGLLRARLHGRTPELGLLQGLTRRPKAAVDAYLATLGAESGRGRTSCR